MLPVKLGDGADSEVGCRLSNGCRPMPAELSGACLELGAAAVECTCTEGEDRKYTTSLAETFRTREPPPPPPLTRRPPPEEEDDTGRSRNAVVFDIT